MILCVWNLSRTHNPKSAVRHFGRETGRTAGWFRVGADDQPSAGRNHVLQEVPHHLSSQRRRHILQPGADEIAVARHRLPYWADRIAVGNALDWIPGRSFAARVPNPQLYPRSLNGRVGRLPTETPDR